MATVVGVFDSHDRARAAIEALHDEGFSEDEVSVVAKDRQGSGEEDQDGAMDMIGGDNITDGAAWGSGIGALGGFLAGLGALAIPGLGPIVAAGPLAAALSGAVAGGIAGGLIDLGIPDQESRRFEQDVKEGRIVAVVETERENVDRAKAVLERHGADEVKTYK